MSTYTGVKQPVYTIDDNAFASGGEGSIHSVFGSDEYVAKIYKSEKRTKERELKLLAMIDSKPNVIEQYAWPVDILYNNKQFIGYVMPKVEGKTPLRNIYVYDNRGGNPWSLYVAISRNLASAVHNVHEIGQVIGDLNPENILVDTSTGLITLVDTDSYHITDAKGRLLRCEVAMPEFTAPELQGKYFPSLSKNESFTEYTDNFSLAVLIFQLLMNGAHPFACKYTGGSSGQFQPLDNIVSGVCIYFQNKSNLTIPVYSPEISCLPNEMQNLFRKAFVDGYINHASRPTAEEWYNALNNLDKSLTTCLATSEHIYFNGLKDCPWCEVAKKMGNIYVKKIPSNVIPQTPFSPKGSGNTVVAINPQAAPPVINTNYTPQYSQSPAKERLIEKSSGLYWLITMGTTLGLCLIIYFFITPIFFDTPYEAQGFFESIIAFILNLGPISMFIGGMLGSIIFNSSITKNHDKFGLGLYIASPLVGIAGNAIIGLLCIFAAIIIPIGIAIAILVGIIGAILGG